MHIIRECINAKERWRAVMDPAFWDAFPTLEGEDWVCRRNLKQEAGKLKPTRRRLLGPNFFVTFARTLGLIDVRFIFNEELDQEGHQR